MAEEEENQGQNKSEELLQEAKNFFEQNKKVLGEAVRTGRGVVYLDFAEISQFSNKLSEEIILNPEDTLALVEQAIEQSPLLTKVRVRLRNLPESHNIKIREIRSKHLNELVMVEGIIRQASDVRPQVVNAKFECPSCGTVISVLQVEKKFREPSKCSCGRRGGFKLLSKEMVDTQRLVVEESPESLSGGEQPKRLNVFVKEDLVEPRMEEKTTPGARVKVIGVLKEVPVPLSTGGLSTRFELSIESNNLIPMEETFEELDISEEDEKQILELSQDPKIFNNLAKSVAPSVWGYEEIKKSLVLQLFGGVEKKHASGQKNRGDMHILLIGDPGVAKSIGKEERILYKNKKEVGYKSIEEIYKRFGKFPENLKVLTIDQKNHIPKWRETNEIIKHLPEKDLIEIETKHGKRIKATKDHSFITLNDKGEIVPLKGEKIDENTFIPIPINYHKKSLDFILTKEYNTSKTSSRQLPEKIKLDKDFGFLFGAFLSEGYIKSERTLSIFNKNRKFKEKIKRFFNKTEIPVKISENEIKVYSKSICNLLKSSCYENKNVKKGIKGNYSRIKKIPEFAFFSPKQFIYGLISGLFSGNGRFVKDKKIIKGFELITISKRLSQDTSDLLFSIGINNKIKSSKYTYKQKETDYYNIHVSSSEIRKFRKNIEFYGREYLKYEKPTYSYNNMIPCGSLLYNLVKKAGYNEREGMKSNRTLAAEMRTVKSREEIGKLRLRKILKYLKEKSPKIKDDEEFSILKKIAYSQIVWSKVSKIDILKKKNENVYDLSVPETNTFVANGIGVHNSVTLEFMAEISPKGRYVVGKSASGAGLTATVVRDEYLKGWSLEAGAMVLCNKGLVCIDELEKMDPQDRSAMHEAMEQQCYLPNFKLDLSDGTKKEIGLLVDSLMEKNKNKIKKNDDCEILSLTEDERIELLSTDFSNHFPINVSKVSRRIAPKQFVKIKLTNGREITVTPEHPCWINSEGKVKTIPANKLKKGMYFPVPSKTEYNSINYKKKNDDLCKILGYHISDGFYELNRGKKTGIQFWNNNEDLIKDYNKAANDYFGVTQKITKRKHQFASRLISKKVKEKIESIDKNLLEKGDKRKIPNKILRFPKENIAYLLRALYDGDGSVSNQRRNGCRVSFVSHNKELSKQVSDLLLRFGIQSTIMDDTNPKVSRVDISGEDNLKKFFNNIGFLSKHKKQKLKLYLEKQKTYRTINDIIPTCTNKISQIYKELGISMNKEIGHSIDLNAGKQRKYLQKLILIAEKYAEKKLNTKKYNKIKKEIQNIKKTAFGYARWRKIKSIEKISNSEINYVYDVTIEPTHSFISNNMILHNSVTISKANVQACYSDDTEVLTEKGWKRYNEVKDLKIAQYNPLEDKIKFLPHRGLYLYDYKGKMYNFKNRRNDILVTPDHKMLAKEFSQKKLKEIKAKDLTYNYIKFVNSGNYIGKAKENFILPGIKHKQKRIHKKYTPQHKDKKIPMDLFLEFLGYFVTEGGVETCPTIGLVQKKGGQARKIKKCMERLSKVLDCSLSEVDCGKYVRYKITQTQLYEFIKNCREKCSIKELGLNFSELSKEQINVLFNAMMLGDGSSDGKSFSSTSEKLADEFQTIAHLSGKSASKHIQYKKGYRGNRKKIYRIVVSDKTEPSIRRKSIEKIDYKGKVFCFSTHTGFFVTRRKGKIAIQGNTLRAETSVLAAANPKFGRFDPYQPIAQQIDIPPTLINRFDVIFTLRDIPNKEKDEQIATHVLKEHQHKGDEMLISREIFRKYVAYAKQKIYPALTEESAKELKDFYIKLRNAPVSSESEMRPIPISARQLQALVRMAEASAKIRLSETVEKSDALEAIELMKYYLQQVGYDYESKTFDIDRIGSKFSSSQRNKIMMVKETILALSSKIGKEIPIEEIREDLKDRLEEHEIQEGIDKLLENNEFYRPKRGYIGVF